MQFFRHPLLVNGDVHTQTRTGSAHWNLERAVEREREQRGSGISEIFLRRDGGWRVSLDAR